MYHSEFAGYYHQYIIKKVKETYPSVPLILFVHKGVGAFLENMVASGADVINVDWTLNLKDIRSKVNMIKNMEYLKRTLNPHIDQNEDNNNDNKNINLRKPIILQGNLDPMVLLTNKNIITREVNNILKQTGGIGHIMNLGHGIESTTKEENVQHFVDVVKNFKINNNK